MSSKNPLPPNGRNSRYTPIDCLILGYLAYIPLLILMAGRPLGEYFPIFIGNALVAALVWSIVRYLSVGKHWLASAIRVGYPALLFGYFYHQTGALVHLFYGEFWDSRLVAFEASMWGGDISIWLDAHLLSSNVVSSNPAKLGTTIATEIASFCYFGYYLMFPAVIIPLLIRQRYERIQELLFTCAFTFFVSYNLFWLFPLEGPRWHFASVYSHSVSGPFFRQLVDFVIANGAVRGGCMPSTHAGVALVVMVFIWREYRRWFWSALPLALGLCVGAVYGRFHYITDVVVGLAIAALCIMACQRWYPRWRGGGR